MPGTKTIPVEAYFHNRYNDTLKFEFLAVVTTKITVTV
jgi:hypothetical protein